ncbi:hypothetical protein BGW36DRAFT_387101 [Talaromyces proteolyticus]|uniref:Uncharacterized protein n=1 Tax=Talaromyces proteolyticus TaxID=1131652 RepID=A0AAD4KK73_9EURO|nr:uncharacterized protein BGW36DRAFT_387101 [Talaromyces proteolyticus]KAH8692153.1 hypothetical protein BGW36DRAFT_387101 [Talaromyces proteolyticus]
MLIAGIVQNVSVEVPEWRHSRSLVNPLFTCTELSCVECFKRYMDKMMAKLLVI